MSSLCLVFCRSVFKQAAAIEDTEGGCMQACMVKGKKSTLKSRRKQPRTHFIMKDFLASSLRGAQHCEDQLG